MMDQEEEINLLDYWRVLVKRKKYIALIGGMAFVTSIVVSLLLPKIYAAQTSILPPQQDTMSLAFGAKQMGGAMEGLAGGLLGLKTPADLWVGILKSNTVNDAIIDRFKLKEGFKTKTIEETRKALKDVVKILKEKEGIISITVEGRDPKRAAQMANAFIEELDKVNKQQVMTSGGRMRVFVEKRLLESKQALTKAEEAVRSFQEQNKAVKLDDQSKAIIGAVGALRGELMAREVELQTMLSFATPNHPKVGILQTEVEELKERLRELAEGKKERDNPRLKDIFIPTAKIPDLGLRYVRLLREVTIQETLHTLLTQQYEISRIQEAKDSPTVQVLDVAKVPEKKVKPKRTLIVLLSTFTAGFFSIFLVFFMEFLEKNRARQPISGR